MAAAKTKVGRVAFCSLIVGLCVALMAVARLISITDYCITLACGLLIGIVVIECGSKWALLTYIVASVLGMIVGSFESAALFLCLFGYYSIIKPLFEKLPTVIEWLLKLLLFNLVIILAYSLIDKLVMPVSNVPFVSNEIFVFILLVFANFVFVLYDILFNKLMTIYYLRLHKTVSKYIK